MAMTLSSVYNQQHALTLTLNGVEYNMQELIDSYNAVRFAAEKLGDRLSDHGAGIHNTVRRLLILAGLEADSKYMQDVQMLKDLGFDTDNMTTETFDELIACLGGGANGTK